MKTQESKQELEKEMFDLEQELDIPSNLRWHNSKPKQETLEEAAANYLHRVADGKRTTGYSDEDFIEGAKWQQEQDKNKFSEEEVIYFAKWCAEMKVYDHETYVYNTFETLLEQFKNK